MDKKDLWNELEEKIGEKLKELLEDLENAVYGRIAEFEFTGPDGEIYIDARKFELVYQEEACRRISSDLMSSIISGLAEDYAATKNPLYIWKIINLSNSVGLEYPFCVKRFLVECSMAFLDGKKFEGMQIDDKYYSDFKKDKKKEDVYLRADFERFIRNHGEKTNIFADIADENKGIKEETIKKWFYDIKKRKDKYKA